MSKIIINQPAMLGDLLFIEPIIRNLLQKDHEVIWPIKDQYFWLGQYIKHHGLKIVKQSEYKMDYEDAEIREGYLPLRFATPIFRNQEDKHSGIYHEHFMLDKYRLMGLPLDMWRTLTWERNYEKESDLFDHLALNEDEPYTLVNCFMKDCFEQQLEMKNTIHANRVIELRPVPGFTMLDWAKVICHATEIHTVETALIYIIEVLPITAKEIHMYARYPWQDKLNGVKNFISDKWIKHEYGA